MKSWVAAANDPASDFPIQNLPYGVFDCGDGARIGVAIGDRILDLRACAGTGLFDGLAQPVIEACNSATLNLLMSLGRQAWSCLRERLTALLDAEQAGKQMQERAGKFLVPMCDAAMQLPAAIGDYSDFYASIHHATRVGAQFRPQNPLLPNYKYVPIGYHGRASSIVVSGATVRRPSGQIKPQEGEPVFGPTQSLDYELEVGLFVGPGNPMGSPIPIAESEQHIFGLCLVNDWSARDIQSWEYQPLGPFLAKSFATSISPWIVPLEALAPYRVPAFARPAGDPAPFEYLREPSPELAGIDLSLEVFLQSARMRDAGMRPQLAGRSNLRHLYWSLGQLLTHHASNGCNLRPGDLLATGTVSGPEPGSQCCLLELCGNSDPLQLPTGELRRFLQDGDCVTLRAYCQQPGLPRIGFGECTGTITGAT
jgi:fumarylacetoacetase